jgi:hypothetical protein
MEKLFTLLALQRKALESSSKAALAHIAVNDTVQIVPYKQAIFWSGDTHRLSLEKVSGNAVLDDKAPYAIEVKDALLGVLKTEPLPSASRQTHDGKSVAILIFRTQEDGILGGLWLENDRPFSDAEIQVLEELCVSYTRAFALLALRKRQGFSFSFKKPAARKKYLLIAALVTAVFPVRETITAPAEIVARNAEIVTVPFDGMVERIETKPGNAVAAGDVLAVMEDSALAAQVILAEQSLTAAESALARARREALGSPEKRGDITRLESEIAEKRIEFDYAKTLRENGNIKAPRFGTAIFSDAKAIEGKPARMGDPLMMIADPADAELLVRVPVPSMIEIAPDAPVHFYLNVSPLSGRAGNVTSIGYQASPDPDGLLTYKLRADIADREDLRIGWQGTAKIKGRWTVLSYKLLRRPIAAFRHVTGF